MTNDPMGAMAESRTPGTPLYGILGWRSDSIMLARLRPVFADLIADALVYTCVEMTNEADSDCRSLSGNRDLWCPACRLSDLAERVQRVTTP